MAIRFLSSCVYGSLMEQPLALSSEAAISLEFYGEERQPIIIADNALVDPDKVVEIAARQDYSQIGPYYPGLRAPVPSAAALQLVQPLAQLLAETFGLTEPPRFEECYLSLVTVAPDKLSPIQRIPHIDGTETERLAVLLYLDKAEQGGTAFYRHRSTGFESVGANRLTAYQAVLHQDIVRHGEPDVGYMNGGTVIFEEIHAVAGRYNRAICYRGNILHCGMLPNDFIPQENPRQGRLTLNLFLNAKP